jgi:hypothetical protein
LPRFAVALPLTVESASDRRGLHDPLIHQSAGYVTATELRPADTYADNLQMRLSARPGLLRQQSSAVRKIGAASQNPIAAAAQTTMILAVNRNSGHDLARSPRWTDEHDPVPRLREAEACYHAIPADAPLGPDLLSSVYRAAYEPPGLPIS